MVHEVIRVGASRRSCSCLPLSDACQERSNACSKTLSLSLVVVERAGCGQLKLTASADAASERGALDMGWLALSKP